MIKKEVNCQDNVTLRCYSKGKNHRDMLRDAASTNVTLAQCKSCFMVFVNALFYIRIVIIGIKVIIFMIH